MATDTKQVAQTVVKVMDGLRHAGMLSENGVHLRNLIATGLWKDVGERVRDVNMAARIAVERIATISMQWGITEPIFGPRCPCSYPGCSGIVHTTCFDGRLCTTCWRVPSEGPERVRQIE